MRGGIPVGSGAVFQLERNRAPHAGIAVSGVGGEEALVIQGCMIPSERKERCAGETITNEKDEERSSDYTSKQN
jgi:hypothetical protein